MITFAFKRWTLRTSSLSTLIAAKHFLFVNDARAQFVTALYAFFFVFIPRHNRVSSLKTASIMVVGNDERGD
jgi:hypothetical protein